MGASDGGRVGVENGVSRQGVADRRTRRLPLPPHPIAAEQARVFLRLVCAGWGLGGVVDDLLLIAAELVTNAMRIGDVFELAISRRAGIVLVEVRDASEAVPDRRDMSLDRVDGRGLLLVEACSKDWGWRLEANGGKTTWAIVEA